MNRFLPSTAVGFEIAGQDLRVAVIRSSLGKTRVVRSFSVGQFAGLSRELQLEELRKLAVRHTLGGLRIFLTLPQGTGFVRGLDFPVEAREKIRAAVELQVESLSPWPLEDIYWDMSEMRAVRESKSITATVAIVTRDALDPWIDLFDSAGLPLSGFSFSTMAWAHASSIFWPDQVPTILLSLEPDYAEGSLISGSRITSIGIAGDDPSSDRAVGIVRHLASLARVSSLEGARTLACGSSVDMLDRDNPPIPIEGGLPESATAFGAVAAALSGLDNSPFSINLVPAERQFRRNQMEFVPTLVLLVLVVLATATLALREPYQWSVYASQLDEAISAVAPTVRDVTDQEEELNGLSERYRALATHLDGRDRALETLQELVGVLPSDTWLSAFTFEDNAITISGFSTSASELQRLIEESTLFENAEFANSVTRDAGGRDRFTLRFDLGGAS